MIGDTLKVLRKLNKKTQSSLAKFLSISQAAYSKYECNLSEPDTAALNKLANLYGVTTDYLLGRPEIKEKPPTEAGSFDEFNQALEGLGIAEDTGAQRALLKKINGLSSEQKKLIMQMIENFKQNNE